MKKIKYKLLSDDDIRESSWLKIFSAAKDSKYFIFYEDESLYEHPIMVFIKGETVLSRLCPDKKYYDISFNPESKILLNFEKIRCKIINILKKSLKKWQ